MAYEAFSALRVYFPDLWDAGEKRRPDVLLAETVGSAPALCRAWVPQTLGEQIWVVYEFPSEAERVAWEQGLPPLLAKMLDRDLIPRALGWVAG
jgi:hypothetical protein